MGRLDSLGMRAGWIYEVIVSTFLDDEPHATPIGVWTNDPTTLQMEIFASSRTLKGLLTTKHFAANFPAHIGVFHAALFHPDRLSFEPALAVRAPLLRDASATVELTLGRATPSGDRVHVTGTVARVWKGSDLRLLNRADGLLLESLILATRLQYLDAADVRRSLVENHRVIRKVAPGSAEERTMAQLLLDIEAPAEAPAELPAGGPTKPS